MPILAPSASDITATVKAGAEVNAAIGGAVAKGGNSAPPRAGGTAAAAAAVTQSRAAQTSTTPVATVFRIPPIVLPVAWTPAVLNYVRGWFDGSDPLGDGTVPANDTVISSWKDKSGNARHATAKGSPIIITSSETTKRGLRLRDSAGVKHSFSAPYVANFFSPGFTFIYVYKCLSNAGYVAPVTRSAGNGGTFDQYGNNRGVRGGGGGSSWDHGGAAPNGALNNTSICCQIVDPIPITSPLGGAPGSVFREFVNGTAMTLTGSLNSFAGFYVDDSPTKFFIGDRDDGATGFEGDMYEVIVFNSPVSTEIRQTMEGYLAWKWGLVSKLPVTHPYKAFSPVL